MKDKPPSKDFCLRMAALLFEGDFKYAEHLSWKYLFMWGMYEHWVENEWEEL